MSPEDRAKAVKNARKAQMLLMSEKGVAARQAKRKLQRQEDEAVERAAEKAGEA